jgi:hypothetical protein
MFFIVLIYYTCILVFCLLLGYLGLSCYNMLFDKVVWFDVRSFCFTKTFLYYYRLYYLTSKNINGFSCHIFCHISYEVHATSDTDLLPLVTPTVLATYFATPLVSAIILPYRLYSVSPEYSKNGRTFPYVRISIYKSPLNFFTGFPRSSKL